VPLTGWLVAAVCPGFCRQCYLSVLAATLTLFPLSFLCCTQADDPDTSPVCDILGVEVLPTVQFWREGKLLWEHRGVNQLEQNMGEGVLYFGDRCVLGSRVCAGVQGVCWGPGCSGVLCGSAHASTQAGAACR
jgi:hypothetical protein